MTNIRWEIRNLLYYIKKYKFCSTAMKVEPQIVMIFDPNRHHPGLMDRMKGIVGCYNIAKANNRVFKILFEPDSAIPRYIEPSEVNWIISPQQIDYSIFRSRITDYAGCGEIQKLNESVSQYHIYNYVGHDLRLYNGEKNCNELWTNDYNSLFKPTKELEVCLDEYPYREKSYIAIHIRFVNALELQEPGFSQRPLDERERKKLISDCIKAIRILECEEQLPALVFSDSNTFLDICAENGIHTLKGRVSHISYNSTDDAVRKAFIDLYMIARARSVYQLNGDHLYKSAFSYYGALIGGNNCNRKEINVILGC